MKRVKRFKTFEELKSDKAEKVSSKVRDQRHIEFEQAIKKVILKGSRITKAHDK